MTKLTTTESSQIIGGDRCARLYRRRLKLKPMSRRYIRNMRKYRRHC